MSNNHLGGTYLKPGILKPNRDGSNRVVECIVDSRKGGPRILPPRESDQGKFGAALEIPTHIEGQEFVISIPAEKGDGKTMRVVFGDDLTTWAGKRFTVKESDLLEKLVVQPIG